MEKAYQKLISYKISIKLKLISLFFGGLVFFLSASANAGIIIISDEETELYLQSLIKPIFKAANIPFNRYKIHIVQDNSLNAFVSDGNDLFIHTETILKAKTDDELRGVIAHETGHILGGHILRQKLRMNELQNISLASMVIAGALGAVSGRGDVAMAVALGSQSSLVNQALAYQMQEERSADEAAVTLLKKIHHSPQGMLDFMKKIQVQNKLQGIQENNYFRTHPMSNERISFLQNAVQNSVYQAEKTGSPRLKRIQAKIYAFIKSPQQTYIKYPVSDDSLISRYARAIAAFKSLKFSKALSLTDGLIAQEPDNPHFKELKGQILFELGKMEAARSEFAKAAHILPSSILFKINEAQVALELSPSQKDLQNIITQLQKSLVVQQSAIGWLLLSRAYHMSGKEPEAQYAAARYNLSLGDERTAKKQALEAKKNSLDPKLTLKIDDLLNILR